MAGFEYGGGGEDLAGGTRPFDSDGYIGFDPRLPSQRFNESQRFDSSFRATDHFAPSFHDDAKEAEDDFKGANGFGYHHADIPSDYGHGFEDEPAGRPTDVPPPYAQSFESDLHSDYVQADDFGHEMNGKGFAPSEDDENLFSSIPHQPSNGAVLPPPEEMREEGLALREWKRQNAIRLEEKEVKEREKLAHIIDDADYYKDEVYEKRKTSIESGKKINREKETVFLVNQENFHKTADQQYWKAVAELIPNELPTIDLKRGGNKDKDRKPSVVVNKGPKPGKATDLTRMRQILVKLKHHPPPHMKPPPPPPVPAPKEAAADAPPPADKDSNPIPTIPPTSSPVEASPAAVSA